uniref:AlNc14C103G6125 protein n=1 Tax=Albugo laibachii Nc14 TaxID=890382 RepID=F0WHR8_9STRA|nr:AlNc14C103G6125 [Albugo laibachii Nc14]|eukprot:CCA20793.1 AlNc14C103G6125 [Albugo laibachii Nc14]
MHPPRLKVKVESNDKWTLKYSKIMVHGKAFTEGGEITFNLGINGLQVPQLILDAQNETDWFGFFFKEGYFNLILLTRLRLKQLPLVYLNLEQASWN